MSYTYLKFKDQKDPIWKSYGILKVINSLFKKGFLFFSEKFFFSIIKKNKLKGLNLIFLLLEAIELLKPTIILISKRRYLKVPILLAPYDQYNKGVGLLLRSLLLRKEFNFEQKLIGELEDIVYNKKSFSLDKKLQLEKNLFRHYFYGSR